jgi:hypothetical protein
MNNSILRANSDTVTTRNTRAWIDYFRNRALALLNIDWTEPLRLGTAGQNTSTAFGA